jgi:phthiocerol/phenolphthiocerol synthesis type-I polyketide synthase E
VRADIAGPGIAVVGLALRLPGADDPAQFWANLVAGVETVTRFDEDQLRADGVPEQEYRHPNYVPARGVLSHVQDFDAELFGFSPREAQITDPQHRLFLECAHEALEAAGHAPARTGARIGVFAGVGANRYLLRHLLARPELVADLGELAMLIGGEKDHLATHAAYRLGLRGPALSVQSSCSTSLVAVHLACQALLRDEADMMLAGGASIHLPQHSGYRYNAHDIYAPDGHCRAFDSKAAGAVPGNGVGVVVLKRLADAVEDGDTIYAVIRGSAINNDGNRKVGYTAPSIDGQVEVIRAALRRAGVPADSIGYVETHGTGTHLGDQIEFAALAEAYGADRREPSCALGTLKPNIGHVDIAAGVAGLIKACLALWHGQLPPSINFHQTDPAIPFQASRFYVNDRLVDWPRAELVRRCAVSSFGVGGTNAHLVLEEAPIGPATAATDPPGSDGPGPVVRVPSVVPLSARTELALQHSVDRLVEHTRGHPGTALPDVARTLQVGRRQFSHRSAVTATDLVDLRQQLTSQPPSRALSRPTLAFVFSGQGGQYPGMAAGPYAAYPVFRAAMDDCAQHLEPLLGLDIRRLLCDTGPATQDTWELLDQTWLTQPGLFATQYSVAVLLSGWGLRPQLVLGHSLGEYAAGCLAGAISLPDACTLVSLRGQLMHRLQDGAMLAVFTGEQHIQPLLTPEVSIAAVNGPRSVIVTGPADAVRQLEPRLVAAGVEFRPLAISTAGHSSMLDPHLAEFRARASELSYRSPRIRYISGLTGEQVGQALDAGYWTDQLREPVRFAAATEHLLRARNPVVIEIGPGHALTELIRQIAAGRPVVVTPCLPGRAAQRTAPDAELAVRTTLDAAAEAWCAGVEIDWPAVTGPSSARRVPLPGYPFQRARHWIDPSPVGVSPQQSSAPPSEGEPVGRGVLIEAEADGPSSAGSDRVERAVRQIWGDILGVSDLDPDANFFALGGQSLLTVRMIARLLDSLGVTLPRRSVVARPTLGGVIDTTQRALAARPDAG